VGEAVAAHVVAQYAIALGKRCHLRVPRRKAGTERVREHHHRRAERPTQVVVDRDPIRRDEGHMPSYAAAGAAPCAAAVRALSARNAARAASSGGGVVRKLGATARAQPVAARTCSTVTPGWIVVNVSSALRGSGSSTPRSVMMRVG